MAHYYAQDGKPMHFVPKAKGDGTRATTIRDAIKLNLFPSVTEILNIAAKPALTNWLVDQALMAALTLPRDDNETLTEFMKRAKADSKRQAQESAELGTQIHDDIERLWKGDSPLTHKDSAEAVKSLVTDLTGLSKGWIAEKTFASDKGYGGMIDLHHPEGFVIDYKTKDFDESGKDNRMAYDEHAMQLSAYAHGLGIPNAVKINIFVSRTVPGLITYHEWTEDYFDRFECLLRYWQLTKGYKPEFEQAA